MMLRNVLGTIVFVGVAHAAALDVPVRLTTKLSTTASKVNDRVEAIVIAPVIDGGRTVIPSGSKMAGVVKKVKPAGTKDERAVLQVEFTELVGPSGGKAAVKTRVLDVDNARELVDDSGQILGIVAAETLSGRIDQGIGKLAKQDQTLAQVLEIAKGAVLKESSGDIVYEPGVEMYVRVFEPPRLGEEPKEPALDPIKNERELLALANDLPFQTYAENPRKPSDITNLMFIGSEEQLTSAFKAAGWAGAHDLNSESVLETFKAIVELRGYKEAPMSVLTLEGRKPDLVFQKSNNTFAERHHLRIWRMPARFDGKPVWVASSTHDNGIAFSEENNTFIHTIDPNIDKERAKIVADLLFARKIASLALADRPDVPKRTRNATGDDIVTDGRIAVVVLR